MTAKQQEYWCSLVRKALYVHMIWFHRQCMASLVFITLIKEALFDLLETVIYWFSNEWLTANTFPQCQIIHSFLIESTSCHLHYISHSPRRVRLWYLCTIYAFRLLPKYSDSQKFQLFIAGMPAVAYFNRSMMVIIADLFQKAFSIVPGVQYVWLIA